MTPAQQLRIHLRILRARVPPIWPVRVRRVPIKGRWGECQFNTDDDPFFRIKLDPTLEGLGLQSILIHEYAHCLAWTSEHPTFSDHGPEFGLAYSRVYSALIEP